MKQTLQAGLAHSVTHSVTDDMSPSHLSARVLSTPAMVRLIELACHESLAPQLDDGETSVGTHICVSHIGVARVGEEVTVSCSVREISRRRVTFDVHVLSPAGTISEGTHQRAIVYTARFRGN